MIFTPSDDLVHPPVEISPQDHSMMVEIKEEAVDTEDEVVWGSDPEFESASESELEDQNKTDNEDDRGESKSDALPRSKYNAHMSVNSL